MCYLCRKPVIIMKRDVNLHAKALVDLVTGQEQDKGSKNPAAVELGRLGGLKGGKARAAKLSPERRKEIAKKAAESRWKKTKDLLDNKEFYENLPGVVEEGQ
jgi:hypothetical protein